jgi:hypothetical protein
LQASPELKKLNADSRFPDPDTKPFRGFAQWFRRNRIFLVLLEFALIGLSLLLSRTIPLEESSSVMVYVKDLDSDTKNHFLGCIRDADMLGRQDFWESDTGSNPILNIHLILPEGNKRQYPDSCSFLLSFTQKEDDSLAKTKLKNIISKTFELNSRKRKSMNEQFFLLLDSHMVFSQPSPLLQAEERSKPAGFLSHYLTDAVRLQPRNIRLLDAGNARNPRLKIFLLLAAISQFLLISFFFFRFLLSGK